MTAKNIFTAIAMASVLFCSCSKDEDDGPSKAFKAQTGIGLMVDDKEILTYNENTWQLAFSSSEGMFLAGTDNMSRYFTVKAENASDISALSEGDSFTGDITYSTGSTPVSIEDQKWKVTSLSEDSEGTKLWLWCSKKNVGAVVYKIN
jgi:hypothetical protein